jgi:putative FmdB family regulatory protein
VDDRRSIAHHWQSPGASANPAPDLSDRETDAVPTYQYACTNPEGKHEFERVQSFTDAAVSECPECGAPVRKVYGSVGVVFKGSGFYRTDSRKAAATSESSSSNGSSPTKESSSGTSSSSTSSPSPSKESSSSTTAGSSPKAAAS